MQVLEEACGHCDSVCEAQSLPNEMAEEAMLQALPEALQARLRKRGLCMRQLARHLVKADTVYEA